MLRISTPESNDRITPPSPPLALGYKKTSKFKNRADEIEDALIIIASIVAEFGEAYLPIFERLESELNNEKEKSSAIERALKISQGN